jgi:hypothetical protein
VNDRLDDFRNRYAAAFDAYLQAPGEEALRAGYELGRTAVAEELGVLELAAVHHEVLAAALDARDRAQTVAAAGDFFLESVSALEMVQRILRDSRESALLERKHAEMLRRLSTFLADASLALDATGSLEEILQLAAEHARELVGAERCSARIRLADGIAIDAHTAVEPGAHSAPEPSADLAALYAAIAPGRRSLRMAAAELAAQPARRALEAARGGAPPIRGWLVASLCALDGRELGLIQAFDKQEGDFSELDEAILVQLAQMAAAAVERGQLYERKAHS